MAGGRSTRMGLDKALLPWAGGDLLSHTIDRLAALTSDVRILSGPDARYAERGRPVLPDVVSDAGGLAALVTALRALAPRQRALLLAIDLPLVPTDLLRRLVDTAAAHDAVVPVSDGGPEPFAAVYGATCGPAVEQALAAGRYKMTAFWSGADVRTVGAAELQAFGDPRRLFTNVNTPEEYERVRAIRP